MLRKLLMWTLACSTAPFMCSQQTSPGEFVPDSIETMLDEITVVAKNTINKNDRKVIIPPAGKVAAATSGLDLLQKLTLPGISVNRLTGKVSLNSGGSLKIYINGMPADENQIAALVPDQVLRIEYHDSPGARYGDVDAVIDYITRKKSHGGNILIESMNCIGNRKFATLNELSMQIHNGKSSWALNAGYMAMERNNWRRDYEEIWRYPDHEVLRKEIGLPVKVAMSMISGNIGYQYSYDQSNTFNARLSIDSDDSPYMEEGDRHSLLETSISETITEIREHTAESSLQPSLLLNYRHLFGPTSTLIFNLEGSLLKSRSSHSYSETIEDLKTCDIYTRTHGNRYGILAEGIHEISLGNGSLTSGIRHTQTHTVNNYISGESPATESIGINQAESSIFAEYDIRIRNWGITGGLTGKRTHASQQSINLTNYDLLPKVGVTYKPHPDVFLRYTIRYGRKLPQLAYMTDISQEIQPGMSRRGNPFVKSFSFNIHDFTFSYSNRFINVNLSASYLNESKPVMSNMMLEDGIFVETFMNQKYFRKLQSEAMIAVTPFGEHFSIWVAPIFTRYFSGGNDYSLARNLFRVHFGADATFGHFIFTASTMSGASNHMYGDEMTSEKPMNMILAGYKRDSWSLQAGLFNIMKEYWMKTEKYSSLTPFKSYAHCGKNIYFTIKLSLNLKYGNPKDMRHDDTSIPSHLDMESGIINGRK